MLKAKPIKEIVLKVQNEIGLLANLSKVLAEKGINILAVAAWVEGELARIHLVTDDNLRATEALRAKSYNPHEREAVLVEVPHKPGMLRHVTERLAKAGVDLHHLYASGPVNTTTTLVVFASANNDHAIVVLNE